MKKKWQRFKQSTFFVKLRSWEYWPVYITNIPVIGFWLFFAIRSRALFFFSAVNPVIETGGVLGESKINILNRLPKYTIPKTIFIKKETENFDWILKQMKSEGIIFPIIAKPDVGERGFLVEKVENEIPDEGFFNLMCIKHNIYDDPILEEPRFVELRSKLGVIK